MEAKLIRAALYGRVSTNNGRQDTENQFVQLRQFAATQGWAIVHEYKDYASGKSSKRPQFEAMFDAASHRKFDVLVFWSWCP